MTHTTLITGGNSGIGAAIGAQLLAAGQQVVSLGLELPDTEHDNLSGYTCDLTDPADTGDIAAEIAAKHKVDQLVHNAGLILPNLLLELAPTGITVNVIAPGPVLTDNFWGIVPKDGELQEKIADGIPVGRIGSVDDVAGAAMFFLGEGAGFVTGQVLFVCGGASLGGLSL